MTSAPIRDPRGDHLLTPQNCALVIIDNQPTQVTSPWLWDRDLQFAFQGALHHHFRQPAQQAALTGQLQPARPGPLGQLAQHLLISRRQLRRLLPAAL